MLLVLTCASFPLLYVALRATHNRSARIGAVDECRTWAANRHPES